jgi:hypothetical protein
MAPGWLCSGSKCDVPKDACYVGRYGKAYVWVPPKGVDSLTRLTLGILDIASALPPNAPSPRIDPKQATLKALQDRATSLADILNKLPDKNTAIAKQLQEELDSTLVLLFAELSGKGVTKVEVRKMLDQGPSGKVWTVLPEDYKHTFVEAIVQGAEDQLNTLPEAPQPPPEPFLRNRKNFYNPLVFPVGASTP